jgi:spermidine/putrescine transport system ATP-binding protein
LGEFLVLVSRQAEAAQGSYQPGDTAHAGWRAGSALVLLND